MTDHAFMPRSISRDSLVPRLKLLPCFIREVYQRQRPLLPHIHMKG